MPKRARKRTDNFHSERLPKLDRRFVGRNDEIELHRAKTKPSRFLQAMLAHRATDPLLARLFRDDEPRIGDVRAAAGLIRMQRVAADDLRLPGT